MTRRACQGSTARRGQEGMALVFALFMLVALGLAGASALLVGSAGARATRNARGAAQVHFVAESGLSDALQAINAVGVVDFQADVVNQWTGWYGDGSRSFGPVAGYTYSVASVASAANPAGVGRLVATATGPEGTRNVVVANVTRSNIPSTSPGAIYLAQDAHTDATFVGNAFAVDGNDHNYTGGAGPNPPVPGITTRNDTNTQEVVNSRASQQRDNVTGQGYLTGPPIVPSVVPSPAAPTVAQMNQVINDLLGRAGVVTNNGNQVNGNATFGTTATPQITHFSNASGVTIKGNGNASGAGIMIVEGDLTIQGSFDFKGLVIVRGRTNVLNDPSETQVTGNATVYGSLWTQDFNLVVGGSAIVYYSSQALQLANDVGGGGALPAPLAVSSLADCAQLPAGVGGCP